MKKKTIIETQLFAWVLLTTLVGCSGGDGVMDGIMRSWVGASSDEAIAQWGYPDGERSVAGRRLLFWTRDVQLYTPPTANTYGNVSVYGNTGYYNQTTTYSGGGVSNWNCTRILEINQKNIIVGTDWKGNNCPFLEAGPYKDWRRRTE